MIIYGFYNIDTETVVINYNSEELDLAGVLLELEMTPGVRLAELIHGSLRVISDWQFSVIKRNLDKAFKKVYGIIPEYSSVTAY